MIDNSASYRQRSRIFFSWEGVEEDPDPEATAYTRLEEEAYRDISYSEYKMPDFHDLVAASLRKCRATRTP